MMVVLVVNTSLCDLVVKSQHVCTCPQGFQMLHRAVTRIEIQPEPIVLLSTRNITMYLTQAVMYLKIPQQMKTFISSIPAGDSEHAMPMAYLTLQEWGKMKLCKINICTA